MALGLTKLNNVSVFNGVTAQQADILWASDSGTVLNASATEEFQGVMLQIQVTFHTSGSEDAFLHIRNSADDGTTLDDEDTYTYAKTIPFVAAAGTAIVSHLVPYSFDYLDVGIENQESSDYDLTVTIDYTGSKVTGMA